MKWPSQKRLLLSPFNLLLPDIVANILRWTVRDMGIRKREKNCFITDDITTYTENSKQSTIIRK